MSDEKDQGSKGTADAGELEEEESDEEGEEAAWDCEEPMPSFEARSAAQLGSLLGLYTQVHEVGRQQTTCSVSMQAALVALHEHLVEEHGISPEEGYQRLHVLLDHLKAEWEAEQGAAAEVGSASSGSQKN